MVWTTDSTYNNLVTSYHQGETIYFKAIGLKTSKYYRFMFKTPSGDKIYVGDWTTGVETLTGSYTLPSDAETGSWKLHVREASDAFGTWEHHYVDTCYFEVTPAPPPPPKYYLTVKTDPEGIVTIPGEGWYNASTYVNLTALDLVAGPADNIRYRFDYWDVDGVSQGAGVTDITVFMDANHTATAHYIAQYYLNMTSNPPDATVPAGEGWYDANTTVSIFAPEYVSIVAGASRYRFDGWTTTDMSEISDPSSPSTTVYLDKPKTVTANYVRQFGITFEQAGVDSDYTGTILTVDGNNYDYGSLPVSFWWDEGSTHTFAYHSPLVVDPNAKRYIWESTTGLSDKQSDTITVTTNGTITGNYKTQYQITFDQIGLDSSATGTVVTVNGNPLDYNSFPFSQWLDEGTSVTYSYESIVSSSVQGKRFSLSYVTGPTSPFTVDEPETVVGNYITQYYLTVTSPFGVPSGEGWYDAGTTAYAGLDTNLVDHGNGTRRIFVNWSGDASGTNYAQSDPIIMNAPKEAIANWQTQYYLTVQVDPSGITTILGEGWYNESETVTLTAPDVAGYQFNYWDVDGVSQGAGVNPITVNMDAPHTATAHYTVITPQYTLTITTTTGGITDPAPGSYIYDEGTIISVTAIPDANYVFDHWELDGAFYSDESRVEVTMDSDHELKAFFEYLPPPSVSISPSSATVYVGDSVVFAAFASGGTPPYTYQWYVNNDPVPGATSETWTFTPSKEGIYYIHVVITDSENQTAQSTASRVAVQEKIPTVGGDVYPITFTPETEEPTKFPIILTLVLAGIALSVFIGARKPRKSR